MQTAGKPSRARRLLPDEYRKTFANKQIVCVEYQDITDSDEREIFQVRHGPFSFYVSLLFNRDGHSFLEGSTWNGSHAIRSARCSALMHQLTLPFNFKKNKRKTASHKQPSCKFHPRTPNNVPERRWVARW